MEQHSLYALAAAIIPLWIISLLLVRRQTKRRLLKELAPEGQRTDDQALSLGEIRPQDQAALEIIRHYRRGFLLKLMPDTRFSFQTVNELSQALIREIAQVYYPDDERPELKASLADLVALHNRVGARLTGWLDTLPIRAVKDVELQTVLRYHELYQKVKNHPGYVFLKRHRLDRAARWTWGLINYANPWYWGRQVAYSGGKELLSRLFLAKVAALVGEEALRLYSRRPLASKNLGQYQVTVQAMINLALENGELPPGAANYILGVILAARGLEEGEQLELCRRLAQPRRQALPELNSLDQRDRERIHRRLKEMAAACWSSPEQEQRLAQMREEMHHRDTEGTEGHRE